MEDGIMKKSLFIAAALLALAACSREMDVNIPAGDMTITARTEASADTKTMVEGQTHVYWEPGDEIIVFAGGKSGKFTTSLTTSAASATFNGTLGEDAWTEGMDLWAVYPYSKDAVYSDGIITTVLPSEQVARAGSFGKDMNLAIAHSTTSDLQFLNVGGGIRFSLSQDGITEVVLEGLKKETLAGKVKVGFQDGKPVIQEVTEGKTSITITPPDGEAFKKNAWYYIVAIPGAMEDGFTFHFKKACDPSLVIPSSVYPKTVTIKRGIYGLLTYVDKGMNQTVSDEAITFQDPLVKSIVVKYFDTNNNGELSYHEAAVVLSFLVDEAETRADDGEVNIFAGTDITSFDEMVYFTGLTRIEAGAFAGCTELPSITIPENIESIGDNAFNGCTGLKSITINAVTPPIIGADVFANTGDCPIFVPEDAVEQYITAWGEYEPRIQTMHYPEPEAVDLGLSVKWASFNLGATSPEDYGDYYAWGETATKDRYDWETYTWCMGTNQTLTKYCDNASYGYNGFTDGKADLDPEDDAACVILGDKWRMPTKAEQDELRKCTWIWTSVNGVSGYEVIGPSRNSIFLPAAGLRDGTELVRVGIGGHYWSSSLFFPGYPEEGYQDYPDDASLLNLDSMTKYWFRDDRCYGFTVRPVYGDPKPDTPDPETPAPDAVDLGLPSGLKWASFNLGASKPEGYGDYYAWGETEPYYSSLDPLTWNDGKEAGYLWESYIWCMGTSDTMTKYCSDSEYGYNGLTDTKTILDPEDDAAERALRGNWHMPTDDEFAELLKNCTWEWTTTNGVDGQKVTGPNGNSIFLPAAGYLRDTSFKYADIHGYYWSSSLCTNRSNRAWSVGFSSSGVSRSRNDRCDGMLIRPVTY